MNCFSFFSNHSIWFRFPVLYVINGGNGHHGDTDEKETPKNNGSNQGSVSDEIDPVDEWGLVSQVSTYAEPRDG